ncbi:hypothetical protein AB0B27_03895 [Micromonospora rifamycinica]|uniref:hypothetical protein n=1 Tax=Micromonospora rifamycinica TaxID=291594 RepID=UPI0034010BFF
MNLLRRLAERLRAALAALRGLETGIVTPLPPPLVDPRTSTASLVSRAEARGVADAGTGMLNSWSFGGPEVPGADAPDPGYVRILRQECEVAVATLREQQAITESRAVHVRRWRDEADDLMGEARARMRGVAVREAELEARTVRRRQRRAGVDVADLPAAPLEDTLWEGETRTLGPLWRLLILLGLIAAEIPVQLAVYGYFLTGVPGVPDLALPLALSTSLLLVLGPHVAALLLRARQATGGERRLGLAVLALAAPWLLVAALLGLLRGVIFEADPARLERLHLTPATVVVMFVAVLLVIGVMAFMLGLSRRHPFQEAYVRQRGRRNRLDSMWSAMAQRIHPAYQESEAHLAEQERSVRASYAAAEEAYFAALARTVGDPAFTEAVQQRRGRRPTDGGLA